MKARGPVGVASLCALMLRVMDWLCVYVSRIVHAFHLEPHRRRRQIGRYSSYKVLSLRALVESSAAVKRFAAGSIPSLTPMPTAGEFRPNFCSGVRDGGVLASSTR